MGQAWFLQYLQVRGSSTLSGFTRIIALEQAKVAHYMKNLPSSNSFMELKQHPTFDFVGVCLFCLVVLYMSILTRIYRSTINTNSTFRYISYIMGL